MNSAAAQLVQRLELAGFFALYSLLGDGNLRAYDWAKMLPEMTGETRECWNFFLLGGALPEKQANTLLGAEGIEFLKQHKLTVEKPEGLTLGTLSLVHYRGNTFFIDRKPETRAYFGDDAKALGSLTGNVGRGACLLLYPGCGAPVLPLACNEEIEFTFARGKFDKNILQANLALNGWEGKAKFIPPRSTKVGGRYDLVLATCPSTFEPPGVKMPPMIAGGRDGLDRVREVLGNARAMLNDEGTMALTFLFYSDKDDAGVRKKLGEFLEPYGLEYRAILCSKHALEPGVPVFNMLLGSAASTKPEQGEALARKMLKYVGSKGLEAAYLVKAAFSASPKSIGRQIINYSDVYYGGWTF